MLLTLNVREAVLLYSVLSDCEQVDFGNLYKQVEQKLLDENVDLEKAIQASYYDVSNNSKLFLRPNYNMLEMIGV